MPLADISVYSADKTIQKVDGQHPVPVAPVIAGGEISSINLLPVDVQLVDAANWTSVFAAQRLDDAPTSANSAAINVEGYTMMAVETYIDSALNPTTLQLIAQYSVDGGATWANFVEGYWASMFWEDTATASGLRECWHLPIAGWDLVRFRIVGTGTDATNYFDVTIRSRAFRPAFSGAHA